MGALNAYDTTLMFWFRKLLCLLFSVFVWIMRLVCVCLLVCCQCGIMGFSTKLVFLFGLLTTSKREDTPRVLPNLDHSYKGRSSYMKPRTNSAHNINPHVSAPVVLHFGSVLVPSIVGVRSFSLVSTCAGCSCRCSPHQDMRARLINNTEFRTCSSPTSDAG